MQWGEKVEAAGLSQPQSPLTDSRQTALESGIGKKHDAAGLPQPVSHAQAWADRLRQEPQGQKTGTFTHSIRRMAANPTPTNDQVLLARCHDLIRGCVAFEADIGIKQNTAANLQVVLDAARAALAEVGRLKMERGTRRNTLRDQDREGEVVIGRCRLRLAMLFGHAYSAQWEAAGFHDGSTMVPEVFAKRQSLLSSLALYFEHRPEHQSADMQTTAAVCHATFEALSGARSAVNRHKSVLRAAVVAKNAAFKKLRKTMRSLIRELGIVLAADDARWRRFGLNVPAKETMPQPVAAVTLTAPGHGQVEASWPAAPHARRYRVQMRRAGAEAFEAVATVHGTETLLQHLTPDTVIEVRVIAANKLDEAAASPVATVVVR